MIYLNYGLYYTEKIQKLYRMHQRTSLNAMSPKNVHANQTNLQKTEYLHETDENGQLKPRTVSARIQYYNFFVCIYQMLHFSFYIPVYYMPDYYTKAPCKYKYFLSLHLFIYVDILSVLKKDIYVKQDKTFV